VNDYSSNSSDPNRSPAVSSPTDPAGSSTERASAGSSAPSIPHAHDDLPVEPSLRVTHPSIWLATLLTPPVLTGVILFTLWTAKGWDFMIQLAVAAVVTFFFFGRFVILLGPAPVPPATAEPVEEGKVEVFLHTLSSFELFMMVLYMDLMVALLLSCHTRMLFRLPLLGGKMRDLINDGKFILQENPWMRKATVIGIIAFVTFPLAATGSIGGSIFGRLLGMSRLGTFICVVIGATLGCGLMYLGAGFINQYLPKDDPFVTISGILVVAAFIYLLNRRYHALKHRRLTATTNPADRP